jgi:DME family drug/metabolite transporter
MTKQVSQLAGTLLVAVAAAAWGTWALFLRGHGLPPAWQSVMILSVIAAAWLPMALRESATRTRRGAFAWGLVAACAATDAGNYICYFGALDRGPIALAVLTHYLAPVVVAALAPVLLREKASLRTAICLTVSLAGLALLVFAEGASGLANGPTAALGGLSALFYGLNTLVTKRALEDFAPSELLAYHCALSAALVVLFAGPLPPLASFLWSPIAGAVLMGALGAALFYAGLRRIAAQRAAVLTYLEPLVAALVGYFAFAEPLGAAGLAGGALIVLAGGAIALEKPRQQVAAC